MKKFLLLPLAWLSHAALAQTITIRDISTREPLANTIIKDKNNLTYLDKNSPNYYAFGLFGNIKYLLLT